MSRIKKTDCSLLPPTKVTLEEKIKRTSYISQVWRKAVLPNPTEGIIPENFGWSLEDGKYKFVWYKGHSVPPNVLFNHDSEDLSSNEDEELDYESGTDSSSFED